MQPMQEFRVRRKNLAEKIGENNIAIVAANSETLRSGDSTFRFRQNSYFYYLTGFNEPDSIIIIIGGTKNHKTIIFNRRKDPQSEQWTGTRLGQEAAKQTLHVHEAFPIDEFNDRIIDLIAEHESIYLSFNTGSTLQKQIIQSIQNLKNKARNGLTAPTNFCDLDPILNQMRLLKSENEIMLIKKACDISVQAHQKTMKSIKHSSFEYELEAELVYNFLSQGCRSVAYDPIVASGKNACILHYTENQDTLCAGELVLIDAAGEYQNYAADITRTYPISGKFSPQQRCLYELVLLAQKTAMQQLKPGLLWSKIQETVVKTLTQGLLDLNILHGQLDDLITHKAYLPFYMHGAGHWLGLDVHDVGSYQINKKSRQLEPNMIFTLEPGLYISPSADVDESWWNIGIRIEDNILITPNGYINLTEKLISEPDDLEAYIGE